MISFSGGVCELCWALFLEACGRANTLQIRTEDVQLLNESSNSGERER